MKASCSAKIAAMPAKTHGLLHTPMRKTVWRSERHCSRYVECRVPAAQTARWARARETGGEHESDATAELAQQLASRWAPLDEVPANRHLIVRADRPVQEVIIDVAAWLDRCWD